MFQLGLPFTVCYFGTDMGPELDKFGKEVAGYCTDGYSGDKLVGLGFGMEGLLVACVGDGVDVVGIASIVKGGESRSGTDLLRLVVGNALDWDIVVLGRSLGHLVDRTALDDDEEVRTDAL